MNLMSIEKNNTIAAAIAHVRDLSLAPKYQDITENKAIRNDNHTILSPLRLFECFATTAYVIS